ncbi:hypothetical protein LXA43DRAFT_1104765 [Ganoderma leucocontextum]|nr:hypothetical protein LXA43DRAFT_1104765 [Ganoderma leucocontextum]
MTPCINRLTDLSIPLQSLLLLKIAWPKKPPKTSPQASAADSKGRKNATTSTAKGTATARAPTSSEETARDIEDRTVGHAQANAEPSKRKRRSTHVAQDKPTVGGPATAAHAPSSNAPTREKPASKKVKVDKQAPSALHASRDAGRQFQAPKIDVDKPSSDEEPLILPPKLRRSSRKPNCIEDEPDGRDDLDDDGECQNLDEPMDTGENESGGEREEREMDGMVDIAGEAVTFTRSKTSAGKSESASRLSPTVHELPSNDFSMSSTRLRRRTTRASSGSPSIPDSATGPSTSENDTSDAVEHSGSEYALQEDGDLDDNIESEGDEGAVPQAHRNYAIPRKPAGLKKISHREKKLKNELPQIMSSHGRTPLSESAGANARDGEKRPWLTRTDISEALTPASGKSWKLSKSRLRPEMSRVLDEGIRLAVIALQVGKYDINMDDVNYTPFGVQGLEQYALDALISAAEALEYDGENDIAHRLEAGSSPEYIDPLCAYVAKRLRSYRLSVKAAALQTIPMVLKFSTIGDQAIRQLLELANFIYPRTDQGGFNRAKPYSGDGFREVIKAAFYTSQQYHDAGLKNMHLLRSTYDRAGPDETEIPPTMLALAATAIEAVLDDRVNHTTSDFAGEALHQTFQSHLQDILDIRKNRPTVYHNLMHEIAVAVTDGTSRTQSAAGRHQRRSRIDWDSIVEPSDSEPATSSNKPA